MRNPETSTTTRPTRTTYATFVAETAQRYDPFGVTAYELGNSPNITALGVVANPAYYTSLLCAAYPAIKAVAPDATVLTAGLGGTNDGNGKYSAARFVQLLYADGVKGCFDAISFHPYTYPQAPPDDGTSGWSAMLTVRQTMVANGDGDKKIWISEYGAPTNGPDALRLGSGAGAVPRHRDTALLHVYVGRADVLVPVRGQRHRPDGAEATCTDSSASTAAASRPTPPS